MDIERIRELIPFYLTGTLDADEEAAVRAALEESAELRDELARWQSMRDALQPILQYERDHLPLEQIQEYADSRVSDPKALAALEDHLRSCSQCRKEYELLRQPPQPVPPAPNPWSERIGEYLRRVKWAYAIPVVAACVVAVVFIRDSWLLRVEAPSEIAGSPAAPSPQKILRMVLTYGIDVRSPSTDLTSSSPAQPVSVVLDDSVTHLQLVACVPHDTLSHTLYVVSLRDSGGHNALHQDTVAKVQSPSTGVDTVFLEIDLKRVTLGSRFYVLLIEELPSSLPPGIEPQPPAVRRLRIIK